MSTPDHPRYGQHFQSHDEMKAMLMPSDQTLDAVTSWLKAAGITDIEQDSDWINIRTTVGQANRLLNTEFNWYVSDERHIRRLRTLEYSIPDEVTEHILMVQPTTRFGQIRAQGSNSHRVELLTAPDRASSASCANTVTPTCLKTLYGTSSYTADADSGSKVGFCSYLQEYARYTDLTAFEKAYAPWTSQSFSVVEFNGGLNDQNSNEDSSEANLDVQYIVGLAAPLPVTEYSTGGLGELDPDINEPTQADNENEPYLDFLNGFLKLNQSDLPQVLSTSYGEDEQSVPETYAQSVCNLFAQLASRGVSVIFSSGDSGVGSGCISNDGENRAIFLPTFPAACPWVTSVGATQGQPEKAAAFSAGGFSNYWARPSWQSSAVSEYLTNLGSKFQSYYNASGRGFPDVAAQGLNFVIYNQGSEGGVEGTSCSAPTFSGIIGLLNDARLRAGLSPLGFLNPWLYSNASSALNDITQGSSAGCNGYSSFNQTRLSGGKVIAGAGWAAAQGWDPVTGLGTPNFPKLLNIAVPSSAALAGNKRGRHFRR